MRPLLPPALAARAEAYVAEVAERVASHERAREEDFSLLGGALGLAAFCGELATWGRDRWRDVGEAWVERAVELVNARGARGGLHEGLAGLGFVIARWYPQHAELLAVVDEGILERLRRVEPAVVGVSLRNGFAGLLRYALERGEGGAELLEVGLGALEALAVRDGGGLSWSTAADYAEGRGLPSFGSRRLVDFGVAHGQAGVLHALAGVARVPSLRPRAEALLRQGLAWLWAQAGEAPTEFGRLWIEGGASHPLNLNTWCTGNPGVAACAYHAAAVLEDGELERRALALVDQVVRGVAAGEPPGLPGRVDLCCGTAGVATLLAGLHEATDRPSYAEACVRIAEWTLDAEARQPSAGVGLQFGPPGIALMLVALLGGPTGWTRAFCSGPP